jgi:threonine dehydrogenase-like Zn-dependent dehydrogenase
VCRTDLHVVDGDLPHPKREVVPGHEIVGERWRFVGMERMFLVSRPV